jgi:hypothetical protein
MIQFPPSNDGFCPWRDIDEMIKKMEVNDPERAKEILEARKKIREAFYGPMQ